MDLSCFGPLKRKAMLLSRPMKKMKRTSNKCSSKRKKIVKVSNDLFQSNNSVKRQKKLSKTKEKKQSQKTCEEKTPVSHMPVITDYYCASEIKTDIKRIKKIPNLINSQVDKKKKSNKNDQIRTKIVSNKTSSETVCKRKQSKDECPISPPKKKFRTIDDYLKKVEKPSISQDNTPNCPDTNLQSLTKELNKSSYTNVENELGDIKNSILYTALEKPSFPNLPLDNTFSTGQDALKSDVNLRLPEPNCNISTIPLENNLFIEPENVSFEAPRPNQNTIELKENDENILKHLDESSINKKSSIPKTAFRNKFSVSEFQDSVTKVDNNNLTSLSDSCSKNSDGDELIKNRKVVQKSITYEGTNHSSIFKKLDKIFDQNNPLLEVSFENTSGECQVTTTNVDKHTLLDLSESSTNGSMGPLAIKEKKSVCTVSQLDQFSHNQKVNDPDIFTNCNNFPTKRDCHRNCELTNLISESDVEKYEENAKIRRMSNCFNLNVIDLLNTFSKDLEQDAFNTSSRNEKINNEDLQLRSKGAVNNLQTAQNMLLVEICSVIDDDEKGLCYIANGFERNGSDHLAYSTTPLNKTTPINGIESESVSFATCDSDRKINNTCQSQDKERILQSHGFFPKIKLVKTKAKQRNVIEMNLKTVKAKAKQHNVIKIKLQDRKSLRKVHKENLIKNQPHKKICNLERFFSKVNKSSKHYKIVDKQTKGNKNLKEEKSIMSPSTCSSQSRSSNLSVSPTKSDHKPLHEIKFNMLT